MTTTPAPDQPAVEPCPHCGASARFTTCMGEVWYECAAVCQIMHRDDATGRAAALAAWNRSAPAPPAPSRDGEVESVAREIEAAVATTRWRAAYPADDARMDYATGQGLMALAARVRALQPSARAEAEAVYAAFRFVPRITGVGKTGPDSFEVERPTVDQIEQVILASRRREAGGETK